MDRHNYTKDWLIGSLAMFFGGRVAEEIVFGADKVTTGAGNDIERATGLARRMVTQFGMSEVIGPLAVGDKEQEIFLGREFAQRREISERTAQMVDDEVKRLIDEAYARATADHSARIASCSTGSPWRCSSGRRSTGRISTGWSRTCRCRRGNLSPDPAAAGQSARGQAGRHAQHGRRSSERRRPNPPARECHAAGAPLAGGGARSAPLPRVGGRARRAPPPAASIPSPSI